MTDECIYSPYAVNSAGYPIKTVNNKSYYHHRLVVKAQPGQTVLHICDNKRCINPNHLKLGTPKENSQDMVEKDRQAKGELAGNSKLTDKEVLAIRAAEGCLSSREAAKIWKISKTNVLDIWRKKIWRHI